MENIGLRCYCAKTFAEKPMLRVAGDALAMKIEYTIFSELTILLWFSLLRWFLPLLRAPGLALAAPQASLHSDTTIATAGYFRLTWAARGQGTPVFELQQASTPGFRDPSLLYRGSDEARMISGRYDGNYFSRVRVDAAGAVVFLAALGLMVFGNRSHRKEY